MPRSVSGAACKVAAVPGLRLLLRTAPFLVGVLAAAVWLRRSHAERPQLEPPKEGTGRFDRERRHEPIDIVTVVDDLLDIGR
jgi:hypothetical protein